MARGDQGPAIRRRARPEVAPGVVAHRTGGHTPGHSVIRLASGGDRLTCAGDAVFAVGFDHPEWYNGFEHDPEEAAPCSGPTTAGAGSEPRSVPEVGSAAG